MKLEFITRYLIVPNENHWSGGVGNSCYNPEPNKRFKTGGLWLSL